MFRNIVKYQFGRISINQLTYKEDLIIFPDRIQGHWIRRKGHFLSLSDLDSVISYKPDILIIGTGMYGLMKVDKNLIKFFHNLNIKIIIEKTEKACDLYNNLPIEKTVAALHLTC